MVQAKNPHSTSPPADLPPPSGPRSSRRSLLAGIAATAAAPVPGLAAGLMALPDGEKLATIADYQGLEFEAVPEFAGSEASRRIRSEVSDFATAAIIALNLLGKTKPELIEIARWARDEPEPGDDDSTVADTTFHMLADARDKAEALLSFITSAQIRFLSAAASLPGSAE
jgi:hypothetical protein